jgi:hypothetical protein
MAGHTAKAAGCGWLHEYRGDNRGVVYGYSGKQVMGKYSLGSEDLCDGDEPSAADPVGAVNGEKRH